jgi:hypothetical protein
MTVYLFTQDDNPLWIKYDGVVIGDSYQFSHKYLKVLDINDLLEASYDVILYHKTSKIAYIKTGFDFEKPGDVKPHKDFISYVRKDKISDKNSKYISIYYPTIINSSFVTYNKNRQLISNSTEFTIKGVCAEWLGCVKNRVKASKYQITEIFHSMKELNKTCIYSSKLGLNPALLYEENQEAWDHIDFVFYTAQEYGIKLLISFITEELCSYLCNLHNETLDNFWTNPLILSEYKRFIDMWLNHCNPYTHKLYKNDPSICMIDIGYYFNTRNLIPTTEWLREITAYIKTIDSSHLILFSRRPNKYSNCPYIPDYPSIPYVEFIDCYTIESNEDPDPNTSLPYIVLDTNVSNNNTKNFKHQIKYHLGCHTNGICNGEKTIIDFEYDNILYYPEDSYKLSTI